MNDRRFDLANEMRRTFGILPSLFWENPEGRAVQARGKDAVIVSSYLRANRHANMLGLYRLVPGDVARELPVLGGPEVVLRTLAALTATGWAVYDAISAFVWVRTMVLDRLGLASADEVLDPEDNRRRGAQRLYDTLPPNPFLDPFFEVYGRTLRLQRRTFAQPTFDSVPPVPSVLPVTPVPPVPPVTPATAEGASEGAWQGASEGASEGACEAPSGGTSTYDPDLLIRSDQVQQIDQVQRTAAVPQHVPDADPDPQDYYAVITALVTKDILPRRVPDHELVAATIERCAQLHITCDPDVVRKAIDSALFRYYRQLRLDHQLPADPRGLYHDHVAPRLPMPMGVNRSGNYAVIAKAARALLADADLAAKYLEGPIEQPTDLVEAVKRFCAAKKIDYGRRDLQPFDVVHRACAAEWGRLRGGVRES